MKSRLVWDLKILKARWKQRFQELQRKIAWRLPKWVVYHAYIRVVANATSGEYSTCSPDEVDWTTALDRWCKR